MYSLSGWFIERMWKRGECRRNDDGIMYLAAPVSVPRHDVRKRPNMPKSDHTSVGDLRLIPLPSLQQDRERLTLNFDFCNTSVLFDCTTSNTFFGRRLASCPDPTLFFKLKQWQNLLKS